MTLNRPLRLTHLVWSILFLLPSLPVVSQIPDLTKTDVEHYRFSLFLSDTSDQIHGEAEITARFEVPIQQWTLNLIGRNDSTQTGMQVTEVITPDLPCSFYQEDQHLVIDLPDDISFPHQIKFLIRYHGTAADGLIISTSRYGNRTFFGDNWPNRARHWLPCVDHPSDKATLEFIISAPNHYRVVSNGYLHGMHTTEKGYQVTHWRETIPIPTKVMVVGVADFAWQMAGYSSGIPVQTWVYAQDFDKGIIDYAPAVEIMDYFQELIGPFPYEKLANVQSKTVYGGMENASCIFYHERSVTGENRVQGLLAHEIAHQWFGNSVAEMDWPHLWLSEGFATYLETCYSTRQMGPDKLANRMSRSRERVIRFYHSTGRPVIDTTATDPMHLLNTNSYQKGAWFLHMLRHHLGEDLFWRGIQRYYQRFRDQNAWSDDFRLIMEEVSQEPLDPFFYQWLHIPGHPVLQTDWQYDDKNQNLRMTIHQTQADHLFEFDLEILVKGDEGASKLITIPVGQEKVSQGFPIDFKPIEVILDPGVKLLFEN